MKPPDATHPMPMPATGRCLTVAFACSLWVTLVACASMPLLCEGDPQRPASDETVVAILRPGRLPAAERELRAWRRTLSANPTNATLASAAAWRCIAKAREDADPRHLGAAVAVLEPWWSLPSPEPEMLVLRATVRQSLHQFDDAIADLHAAVRRNPRLPQAWLTLSTLHCILGNYSAAREAAVHLSTQSDSLTSTTAAAQIASLTGHAAAAQAALEAVLKQSPPGSDADGNRIRDLSLWAATLAGEIAARRGDASAAENLFQRALSLGPRDPYLLGVYADFLLDQNRTEDVVRLLGGWEPVDSLLLRLAEATRRPEWISALGERFEAARARGDRLHLREAARYELRLRRRPASALRMALENWTIQREPADVRLLFESANAAGDPQSRTMVLDWIRQTGLEDVHLSMESHPAVSSVPSPP